MKRLKVWMLLMIGLMVIMGASTITAATQKTGWDNTKTYYYVKKNGKVKKANGITKIGKKYYYFKKGKKQKISGLKKISGNYYYLKKGRAITNSWKRNLKVKRGRYSFYFGKNGKAYTADGVSDFPSTQIKVYKIKGNQYGFDEKAHMVTGLWSTMSGKIYFFDNNGKCNSTQTNKLRAALAEAEQSADLKDQLIKVFGNPKKVESSESTCDPFDYDLTNDRDDEGEMDDYSDMRLIYDHIEINLTQHKASGVYRLNDCGIIVD